ncbi:MAG: spheroidene monooxygenase [Ferruginibacter sp.]
MQVSLTIIRYPKKFISIALFAMALHRLPLWLNKDLTFWKLMGSGKNGTFDKHPDWQQWAIFIVRKNSIDYNTLTEQQLNELMFGKFISQWFKKLGCETWTVFLEPFSSHGTWDGQEPFGKIISTHKVQQPIAVLTRATIRLSKLKYFWQNVPAVEGLMHKADGLITSFGIGEVPWIKQATFSIWRTTDAMKNFAYNMQEHKEVIKKTRDQKWYKEEMFSRFTITAAIGTVNGINPLQELI